MFILVNIDTVYLKQKTHHNDGFYFGGSAETRTPVLLVLPIKDYTFRITFSNVPKIVSSFFTIVN